jgi:hypothetical protein
LLNPKRVSDQGSLPGKSRREQLSRVGSTSSRGQQASAPKRITRARTKAEGAKAQRVSGARKQRTNQEVSDAKNVRRMRRQYAQASAADEALKTRMDNASRNVAIASDIALRAALSATPIGGSLGGNRPNDDWDDYGDGDGNDYGNGYGDDYNGGYNGWCNWYWNSCYPYWNSWCFNSFGFCWGWGSNYSYGWGYNACWSWPCYSPYYSYSHYWPTYAYCTPSVIYNYYEVEEPVTREVVAQEYVEPVPMATSPRATAPSPDFSLRAASEYMSLGDRAFTDGRYGDAVHYYAKAIQFAPTDGVLYLALSDALFATGDYHYAAFALRRSLEFNPELVALGLDKRGFYGRPEEFDQQMALLSRFVDDHAIDTDARLLLAANFLFSLQANDCLQVMDAAPGLKLRQSEAGQHLVAAAAGMLVK